MRKIIFLGGDKRMIFAAEKLSDKNKCCIYGSDEISGITPFDCAVLPAGKSPDGKKICGTELEFSALKTLLKRGGLVFTGNVCPALEQICAEGNFTIIDYLKREELAVANAVPTAEGALALAMANREETIFGSTVLVTGFGRIAKILSGYLLALGARVQVACRKKSDLKWAEIRGFIPVDITDPSALCNAVSNSDIIFNTVPAEIFGETELSAFKAGAVYMELASSDGIKKGADSSLITVITARGLPGRAAPKTAGKIIADTIENILAERSGFYDTEG